MHASESSTGRYYRPELDVIRFIAFSFVFAHHVLPGGGEDHRYNIPRSFHAASEACAFGLSLFFTLSAFLICELLLRERAKYGRVEVKQFYIRRILRIWPLYYMALAIGAVVALSPLGNRTDLVKIGWFAIFLGSWQTALHGFIRNPISPLWSISVEEQFYLFVPWVVKFVTRKMLYVFCVFFVLLSNVSLFYLVGISAKDEMIWANSLVQFECFATGVFLCLVLHGRVPSFPIWQRFIVFVMGWACWFFSILELDTLDVLGRCTSWALMEGYALASLGSMLMLLAFLGVDAKFLPGWAIYLGRISFGLYVFHFFAMFITGKFLIGHFTAIRYPILVLKGIIVLGLTILMAMLSYRYLETPFLKMKKRHAVIESQPILSD